MDGDKTAVIIGAGPAGLTAAYELLKKTNVHPVILEESEMAGGISRTVEHNGNRLDIGGHRFFSKSDEVMKFWTDILPVQGADAYDDMMLDRKKPLSQGGPDPERDERVMLVRTRVSRIYYLKKFFDYPISLSPRTLLNMGFKRTSIAGFGYIGAALKKRRENNLADFMINRFGEPLYNMFFEDYTEKVWGRNPKDISPDWGAQRIRGLSLSKAILDFIKKPFMSEDSIAEKNVETSLIGRFLYPKRGPGQLWEALADEIIRLGGEIRYKTRVSGVEISGGNVVSVTAENDGKNSRVSGDVFISTMPVKDLVAGMGEGAPETVRKLASELPYRDFMTVGLLVKNLKIKNTTKMKTLSDIVPDCWIYVQERGVKIGRLQIFNNWSPYMVKDIHNTVWIGLEYFCDEGDPLWNMEDSEFIEFAIGELCKIGIINREDVLDSVRLKVKKAYPAYFGSYARFDEIRKFLDSVGNLYCVGRNGQHRYNNMDHSMLTAMEAVNSIKTGASKEAIWNVNTGE